MKIHLCFASNKLEERFRRLVTDVKEEIGGWFFCGWPEDHNMSRRKIRKIMSLPFYVIEHVIIIPNLAKNPKESWSAWDMTKATDLAKATARFYDGWRFHFHTHPSSTGNPSEGDRAFWQWLSGDSRDSFGCIVTDRPLRLWPWHIDVKLAASPSTTTVTKECGGFLSWRSKLLKEARREA